MVEVADLDPLPLRADQRAGGAEGRVDPGGDFVEQRRRLDLVPQAARGEDGVGGRR